MLPTIAFGQHCPALDSAALASASAQQAEDYISNARDEAGIADCVQLAFHRIASLPPQQAIPTLIKYLSYKRPLNEWERVGIRMHSNSPSESYPAVQELYALAIAAEPQVAVEPELIAFIASDDNAHGLALENALHTLLLIRHGVMVPLIRKLHLAGKDSSTAMARERLQNSARTIADWCDRYDERDKSKGEDALNQ